jgi:hypothetical protein
MNEYVFSLTLWQRISSLPTRIRHLLKHIHWLGEDEHGMYCALCSQYLTGDAARER